MALHSISGFASPAVAAVSGSTSRMSVEVTGEAQEQMARRLSSAVRTKLAGDPRFAVVEHRVQGALNIALPSRVGWERRLDWTQISYQVRLSSARGHTRVVSGKCWNWNLAVCAKQIADAAAEFGAN